MTPSKENKSQFSQVAIFALYSILFEMIVWGLFGYAVFWRERSGWWLLVAMWCSASQLKPKHFGIRMAEEPEKKP